jgi:uroporphyrinogen-III decarboxylase
MTNTVDFQKPVEAVKSLIALQTETLTKTVELQKKAGEDLVAFFKSEAEKAKTLKTPEDLIKFNTEANTSLFNLLKAQGEAFTALATESSKTIVAQVQSFGK